MSLLSCCFPVIMYNNISAFTFHCFKAQRLFLCNGYFDFMVYLLPKYHTAKRVLKCYFSKNVMKHLLHNTLHTFIMVECGESNIWQGHTLDDWVLLKWQCFLNTHEKIEIFWYKHIRIIRVSFIAKFSHRRQRICLGV